MAIVRRSKKRDAMLKLLKGTDCHPSADWIYQQLKPEFPDLSLGTVYRNLMFFRERGEIQSVGVVKGQERFDALVKPHSHFVCDCCGAVSDLHQVKVDATLEQSVCQQYGFSVNRHELTFYGTCPDCMQNTNTH